MALQRVLVTGGTGFLGSEIVKALVKAKSYEVTAVDINPPALGTSTFSHVRYVRANVLHLEELVKVFNEAKPTIVVHTVGVYTLGHARYSRKGKDAIFAINIRGTKNAIAAAKECGARGFVYTSSIAVLGDEIDADFANVDETWPTGSATLVYGQSKSIAETSVLSSNASDFLTCSLRPATIFGPRDPACVPILHSCIAKGETPFVIGTGTNLCDFAYVSNVADAHVLAVRNLTTTGTAAGQAIFITNGEPVAFRDFCIAVWKEFGHVPPFQVRIPAGLAWWLAAIAEGVGWVVGKEGSLCRGAVRDATAVRYVSLKKATRILGYVPKVSLPEALKITCEHYKRQVGS
ncbi:C-3 sterol dehydrogenase/C-4 decarboxylase-like protein [Lindgomyces ingoldianus]|uniref:C-3 sterol dehydrogenase/C-4 decarboxylase-like protein n=1 Tax=Lindgomyces ingoldianus TaxID=673940 RepID=A0ACB6R6G9_9PLEO|nr:C-3 sterol dehydrogenase/C-4 decarboxylase-like protein [Lindgomyces ingoldianus]KAF2474761.1 C-3 sterol dehydrogenase/C-4 decarboxylase-like protein [Lindgomyces ingoldianus]